MLISHRYQHIKRREVGLDGWILLLNVSYNKIKCNRGNRSKILLPTIFMVWNGLKLEFELVKLTTQWINSWRPAVLIDKKHKRNSHAYSEICWNCCIYRSFWVIFSSFKNEKKNLLLHLIQRILFSFVFIFFLLLYSLTICFSRIRPSNNCNQANIMMKCKYYASKNTIN